MHKYSNKDLSGKKLHSVAKNKKYSILRLMGKMLKTDSIIRPRRITASTVNYLDSHFKNGVQPVYRIPDAPDLKVNITSFVNKGHNPGSYKQRKEQTKSITGKVLLELEHYCDKTTLHGLRYVGDTSLTVCERVFWLLSFSVAIAFAAYYITNIYQKWNSSPVIISFSPFDAQLKSIPFPSVTICNMNQAKKTEVNKIKADGNPLDMKLLDDICNGNDSSHNNYTEQYDWTMLRNFLIRVGNSCSDMLKACKWSSDKKNCEDLFNNDLTDEGLCCSFNRLPPTKIFRNPNDISLLNQTYPENVYDWSPEVGFSNLEEYDDENMVPKRPLGAGAHLGLSVLLDAQVDEYYCSSTSSIGFKVIISNPIETPKMADFGTLLSPGVEARFSIKPSVREASKNLRSVPIKKRQCYFANERRLVYYRSYTQTNCNLECQSNYTFEKCKCIPYYLPRNKSIKACGRMDQECAQDAKENMEKTNGNGTSCSCLPGCFELVFTDMKSFGQLSKELNVTTFGEDVIINTTHLMTNMAVVHFFFSNSQFSKLVKDELYGFTEILSNVGGLLGLCMGFSFLSVVEILYFITIKRICSWIRGKRKNDHKIEMLFNSGVSKYPFMK
ncbi:pickpocket protein 28-like [Diabrotica undecimpunctata]|uniref:pickpocket protein 28-like n=1 Tax=Diabrotica undecimpunctata TaxID=50387 RepID=UPI003B641519